MGFGFKQNKFFPVFILNFLFLPSYRRALSGISWLGILFAGLLLFYHWMSNALAIPYAPPLPSLPFSPLKPLGAFFVFVALKLNVFAIDRFVFSKTFSKNGVSDAVNSFDRFNFYTSQLWYSATQSGKEPTTYSLLGALPRTQAGSALILRLGIPLQDYEDFLKRYQLDAAQSKPLEGMEPPHPDQGVVLGDVVTHLFAHDEQFRSFLISKEVDDDILRSAADWVETMETNTDMKRRWWSREYLARAPGLAKTWAYGPVVTIKQFGYDLRYEALSQKERLVGRDREIQLLETSLLKQAGANVIIVGEPGTGKGTLLLGLASMILEGHVFPQLEFKRIFKLSGPSIVATGKTKGEIEALLINILNEAVYAGDIILAIEDFPELVSSLAEAGVIASQILDPYLMSPNIHIIALANTGGYRRVLELDSALMKFFEKIELREPDESSLLMILEDLTPLIETGARNRTIVTFPGLKKISEAAIRYIVAGALPERAVNLLQEIVSEAVAEGTVFITPDFVYAYVNKKTHIPLGEIKTEEEDLLLKLEERLHERVIDQVEAINAIADTIRRARAGIREAKRPIGSFLFLGPTGVGKTETAKALAAVYFGDEEAMLRFDMTEFTTEEALSRLIGSFQKNEPGILASRIRSHPYGVLLLDEFEKADRKVIDLFLQILDEGFFTDALGSRVNMRNIIIIATSNAGSSLIWEWVKQGIDPTTKKQEMISAIQSDGKFRPELLNRFDSVIIFKPLGLTELHAIAKLMLKGLAKRLDDAQDLHLQISEDLITETVKQGYDPTFGARPMRRFIQERIEDIVAEKIIRKELKRGDTFSLSAEDLRKQNNI